MADVFFILTLTQISIFSLNVCLALIYILLIVSIRRLRHIHNVFRLNVCLALTGCNLFFIVFFTMNQFYVADLYVEKYCLLLFYAYMAGPLQVPLAFISFSFHRLFLIIYYTRPFFSRKSWVVFCLTTQWMVGFLIPVPFLIRNQPVTMLSHSEMMHLSVFSSTVCFNDGCICTRWFSSFWFHHRSYWWSTFSSFSWLDHQPNEFNLNNSPSLPSLKPPPATKASPFNDPNCVDAMSACWNKWFTCFWSSSEAGVQSTSFCFVTA